MRQRRLMFAARRNQKRSEAEPQRARMEDAMSNAHDSNGKANGKAEGPPALTLPYADFSHALIRAHHDAHAMAAANRVLGDALRSVLRRQQDLAFELAEAAIGASGNGALASQAAIFDRAAQAVREVGEAIIDAQLGALRMLQTEAEPERPGFAFPPIVSAQAAKSGRATTPSARASASKADSQRTSPPETKAEPTRDNRPL